MAGKKKTKEEHHLKFIVKHGDFYDYSKFLDDSFILENQLQKIPIICPIHGEWNTTSIYNHKSGRGCPDCGLIMIGDKLKTSKDEWLIQFINANDNKYDYSKFLDDKFILNNAKQLIPIICPIHGLWVTTSIVNHRNGVGCPICSGYKKKSKDEWIIQFINANDNKYDYSKFLDDSFILKDAHQKIPIICPIHGEWNTTTIDSHASGRGCPKCTTSKGELKVEELLKENNINFTNQKRFKECRYKNPLPFDFYLPEQNLCIEFDGAQHFKAVGYWGGEEGLKLQKKKDQIKNKYCKDNGIKLLRIRYDENIEDKMNEILN